MKMPTWWRGAAIAGVWVLVAWHAASAFTGHSSQFWQYDLGVLFNEQSAFYERRYPHEGVTPTPAGAAPVRSDYPPSSFVLAALWLPPGVGWTTTRVWFTLCQIASVAVLLNLMVRKGRAESAGLVWLLAGSLLAMTGLRADIAFGNYALIMTAVLVVLLWAVEQNRPILVTAALAEAMLKPQMGWLSALLFLNRRGWKILFAVAVALVVATTAALAWTGVSPFYFLRSGYSESLTTISTLLERNSLVTVLVQLGLPPQQALPVAAVAGVAGALWALNTSLASATALVRFAFLGLVNRICTYHNTCDDLLLVFALVLFGRRAWRDGGASAWATFALLGITVWAPSRALVLPPAKFIVVAIWLACAVMICRRARENTLDAPVLAAA